MGAIDSSGLVSARHLFLPLRSLSQSKTWSFDWSWWLNPAIIWLFLYALEVVEWLFAFGALIVGLAGSGPEKAHKSGVVAFAFWAPNFGRLSLKRPFVGRFSRWSNSIILELGQCGVREPVSGPCRCVYQVDDEGSVFLSGHGA